MSGAAGNVGSIAGQLGKMCGARVIGIAGGEEKCNWITETLGFDGAIDYKKESIEDGLKRLCPKGVDCYFDNVGGETLDKTMEVMNWGSRLAFCGAISGYNGDLESGKEHGPTNWKLILMRRMKV